MVSTFDRLVTVYRASSLEEAQMVRIDLAGEGIDAFIEGENTAGTLGYVGIGLYPGGIKVLVRAADMEHAEWLLSSAADVEKAAQAAEAAEGLTDATGPATSRAPVVLEYAPKKELSAPEYARRSKLSLAYALVFAPLAILSLYYAIRALVQARREGVQGSTFLMYVALLVAASGIVVSILAVIALLQLRLLGLI